MNYYKFLAAGQVAPFSGQTWTTEWLQATAIVPCERGLHACRVEDLPYWLHDELWSVELEGPVTVAGHKVVAQRGRLAKPVPQWDADAGAAFTRACVGRTAAHAAAEYGDAGGHLLTEVAEQLLASGNRRTGADPFAGVGELAVRLQRTAAESGREAAARLCGYLADAVEMAQTYPVPALGYVAARAAQARRPDPAEDRYEAERRWQTGWLVDRLELDTSVG
ncbi:hypothetical protein ACQPWW_05350 [Micromonospora sp. CA-240977]|uniref:hypothetical protein n=1 Tax=Micromonospora sp. CA-240977 TaxID=3239957 RepID=UPI003D8EB8BF